VINFHPAETYGEGDDFPALFAEEFANMCPDMPSLSPFLKSRTPDSSISKFDDHSPAFSAEALPDTPITQTRPLFTTHQYWNDFDCTPIVTNNHPETWSTQPIDATADHARGLRESQPINSEIWHMFPSQGGLPLYSAGTAGAPVSGISTTMSLPLAPSEMLQPSFMPHNLTDDEFLFPEEQQMVVGCNDTALAGPFIHWQINEHISGQGLNQMSNLDVRRNSKQDDTSRKRIEQMEKERMARLLVKWKKEGMSYKEIKAKGGFKDAESTLRGRYRAYTKRKEERVRKPEWQERDVSCLTVRWPHD